MAVQWRQDLMPPRHEVANVHSVFLKSNQAVERRPRNAQNRPLPLAILPGTRAVS